MTVRRLLLVRHGQTAYNRERRFTGWHDPPLTRRGRAEARALRGLLARQEIDAVYSSDLFRARETARIALDGRPDLTPMADPALREASFGAWEGLTFEDAGRHDPERWQALVQRSADFCAPEGETAFDVHARVAACVERLHERHAGEVVLLVASGGPLQILIAHLFSIPVEAHWRLGMANCSVSIVDFVRDEPLLTLLNGRAHLSRFRDPSRPRGPRVESR